MAPDTTVHVSIHLADLIRDLAVILGLAGLISLVFQRIRQPVVLGYIAAGIIIGPYTPPVPLVTDLPNIRTLAELGVIFLMFSLGLEFSFRKLARVGAPATFTACFEALLMIILGFGFAKLLSWSFMDSLFLGAMLAISSTTIIIKTIEEVGLKHRRFAHMIFGVLIVEDLIAILILVALSTVVVGKAFSGLILLASAAELVVVVGGWFLAGYLIVPALVKYVSRWGSDEILTLVSVALCLLLVVMAAYLGYSVALGAFIMGSILAETKESRHIEELVKPLRHLFAAVFFVSVGMLMDPAAVWEHLWAIIGITALTIVGKILTTAVGALIAGQTLRMSVQAGFSLAQIGEFSFIIASMGLSLGIMSDFLYPAIVSVSLVTTLTTPYLIRYFSRFATLLEEHMPERLNTFLLHYTAWRQQRRVDRASRREFFQLLSRWFLNGLTVTIIFILVSELIVPFLADITAEGVWLVAIGSVLAILTSAPFIWAMWFLFRGFQTEQERADPTEYAAGATLLAMRFLTIIWLGTLNAQFFPSQYVVSATLLIAGVLLIFFHRRLGATYQWFERQFLSTFEVSPDRLHHLAPWDAHLIRVRVHPNADIAGKRIRDTQLRNRFGLSIVAIQRGHHMVVAPEPEELIFPNDELLILGRDENLEAAHRLIERPATTLLGDQEYIVGYELRPLLVAEGSPMANRTIRELGIRERFHAMVVGMERGGQRILNPEYDMELQVGDLLWLVGQRTDLNRLNRQLSRP